MRQRARSMYVFGEREAQTDQNRHMPPTCRPDRDEKANSIPVRMRHAEHNWVRGAMAKKKLGYRVPDEL